MLSRASCIILSVDLHLKVLFSLEMEHFLSSILLQCFV